MHDPDPREPSSRGYLLLQVLVLGLFCLILLRLWHLQILEGREYADKAQQNLLRERSIYALRGILLDRDGEILAGNQPAYALGLVREDCSDVQAALSRISDWTGLSLQELERRYNNGKNQVKSFKPLILVPSLSFAQLAKIESHLMNWPGLQIITRPQRHYPEAPVFSHVLGYVAQANKQELRENPELQLGDTVGKQGLEMFLDSILQGQKGGKFLEVDAQGRVLKERIVTKPEPGETIRLTIDADLQRHVWREMGEHSGAVVVMRPNSGDVLALVSKPGFNGNAFVEGISQKKWQKLLSNPRDPLRNRAVQSAYPPGSVFKLVIASAALQRETVTLDEELHCPGYYRLGNRVFRCWKNGGHGDVALREAIKQSCDVYFYKLGEKLGIDAISEYARRYGFQQETGIPLPEEHKGLIPSREWKKRHIGRTWQKGETLNTAIGQGYTLTTPLQIARYVAALVNGGHLLKPKLLVRNKPAQQERLPLSGDDLNFLLKSMRATVEEPHGTAWRLRRKDALIGGKTGTAQVIKLKDEYRKEETSAIPYKFRDHAWMASYGIRDKEKYIVVALIEHGGHGSSAAGPVVKSVYDHLFP
ncbi:MAG: penicillin-binding protein 2 [Desulfohalobiaceae bacterium]|nr:penicillin-binding protein 2 [Desulfohalobiaceae bacterium]